MFSSLADGAIKKTVGIVVSFLVICLLLLAGIFYMCRYVAKRRDLYLYLKHIPEKKSGQ